MYIAKEITTSIKDKNTIPCFGVGKIATCFLLQLDSIAQSTTDNLCMIGIFGQWGRGKTYFWNHVKAQISDRQDGKKHTRKERKQHIHYDIVEFNAWKYQDTPALWAHLYKTMCNSAPKWIYVRYILKLWRTWKKILYILFGLGIVFCAVNAVLSYMNALIPAIATLIAFLIKQVVDICKQGKQLIPQDIWRRKYDEHLGAQNELELALEKLFRVWICKTKVDNHKIILYIDDIDRCDENKMINILDSLRTILENSIIQQRLIVICSLDQDRVVSALQQQYNNETRGSHRDVVTEQLDKLFLFGIGLPQLDDSQQQRFVRCLSNNISEKQDNFTYSLARPIKAIDPDMETEIPVTECEIAQWLQSFIESNKKNSLTPRTIRVIYYRLLFASSLISTMEEEPYMTEALAHQIFNRSIQQDKEIHLNECCSDILEIVVPY